MNRDVRFHVIALEMSFLFRKIKETKKRGMDHHLFSVILSKYIHV